MDFKSNKSGLKDIGIKGKQFYEGLNKRLAALGFDTYPEDTIRLELNPTVGQSKIQLTVFDSIHKQFRRLPEKRDLTDELFFRKVRDKKQTK
jgi:hypothetical protein